MVFAKSKISSGNETLMFTEPTIIIIIILIFILIGVLIRVFVAEYNKEPIL